MKLLAFFSQGRSDKSVGFSHLQQRSPKDVASFCVQLLPALCSHLENCHNHFQVQTQQAAFHSFHFFRSPTTNVPCSCTGLIFLQTLLSDNNGVVDGPATDAQEHQLMSWSYQLLLQVLNATFSWWGPTTGPTLSLWTRLSVWLWILFTFTSDVFMFVCLGLCRSGFSQPGQRSLLKKALGVLAGRLQEGGADWPLEQLVKWAMQFKEWLHRKCFIVFQRFCCFCVTTELCLQHLCVFFRHSFEYLLNFRSTMPSLGTALCLSQLLSTVTERGGNPAPYREQTGQSDTSPHLNQRLFVS